MSYALGVDLGTTFTAAARAREGRAEPVTLGSRSLSVPSVVYLHGDDLLVGEPAARRAATDPGRVAREFKRRVGDPTPLLLGGTPIAAELLMARLLAWTVGQVATTEGEPPQRVAVTHPANWGEYKLDLFRQAIRHVDLTVADFVPEPVAAASFYASERDLAPGSVVAVYDLGGGTFDAAMVGVDASGYRILGRPDGIERLGGIDFDHAVFGHVLQVLDLDPEQLDPSDPTLAAALVKLRHDCVEAKEALSQETEVSIPVLLPNRHTEVRLTRYELESMIRPALGETITALQRAISSAQVSLDQVSAVLLVGGSSRIPLIAQLVTSELGRPVAVDARPKEAIPLGAALLADRATQPVTASPTPPPVAAVPPGPGPTGPATPGGGMSPGSAPVPDYLQSPERPSSRSNRLWLVLGAAAIAALLVAATQVDPLGGDDSDGADGTTTTTTTESTSSSSTDESSTTSGTSGGEAVEPLPGDDWGPEARDAFVPACTSTESMSQTATLGGIAPEDACGCIYDKLAESDLDFAEFNEVWVDEDVPPDNPVIAQMRSATFDCAFELAG